MQFETILPFLRPIEHLILDPDISEANALDQAPRVARARHLSASAVVALVHQHIDSRAWGVLGENTVNVLDLNVALDRLTPSG